LINPSGQTGVNYYDGEAINAGLQSLKSGAGTLGKVAVIVDGDVATC
jgi:hypothetical protein